MNTDKQNKKFLCWKCGSLNHGCNMCPDKLTITGYPYRPTEEKSHFKKATLCWKCGKTCHWTGDCPDKENIVGWPFRPV